MLIAQLFENFRICRIPSAFILLSERKFKLFKQDNTELFDKVNAAIKELKEDGTIASIIEKYIPAEGAAE